MNVLEVVALVFLWAISGYSGGLFWWYYEFKELSMALCFHWIFLGPTTWLVGWFVHGKTWNK